MGRLPFMWASIVAGLSLTVSQAALTQQAPAATPTTGRTMADVLAASQPSDWRPLDAQNTLYMDLPSGRVVIELAPTFAPKHVANIEALVREGYFNGLGIVRSQDNFVAQWGDSDAKRPIKTAKRTLPAEFVIPARTAPFIKLPDRDTYAAEVGFSNSLPAARDISTGRAWLVHCYGMVGVGRDNDVDSGGGTELYVVTGHSPRQLDRNVTLVGRVVQGMELLSTLPRGTAPMGFYEKPEQRTLIKSIRVASDVPDDQRAHLEVLRTDTRTFTDLVESRRNRRDEWYKVPAGAIDVCNVPLPVRTQK
jgi:cyclophilin family peptidyl-prolyl cis-trans isomerase